MAVFTLEVLPGINFTTQLNFMMICRKMLARACSYRLQNNLSIILIISHHPKLSSDKMNEFEVLVHC